MPRPDTRRSTLSSDYPPPFHTAWLKPSCWHTWMGLGAFFLFSLLPGRLRRRFGEWAGERGYPRNAKRRRIVETNLEWCFPQLDDGARKNMARLYFRALVRGFVEYGVLWWAGDRRLDRLVQLKGTEHLDACIAAGRPVILLTSHNVGLDIGAAALTRHYPAVGLIKPLRNPVADWAMARGRTRFKGVLFRRDQGLRPVIRAMRAGHVFYYLPDEDLGPENSIFVPFFGVEAATITALPRLARLTGAVVLPFATVYSAQEDRYTAEIFPPLEGFPSGDDAADTRWMNQELERMIRRAPEQYMWSMRIFHTRPDGAPTPYPRRRKRRKKARAG